MENKKMFTLYVILGGTEENMQFRVKKVIKLVRKGNNPIILIAALSDEAEWIINYWNEFTTDECTTGSWDTFTTHQCIKGPGSWDTLTNVTKEILPFAKNLESQYGEKLNRNIIAPTGDSHGKRLKKIFNLISNPHSYLLLACPLTGEPDGRYEKVPNIFYKMGKPGIYFMSWVAFIFRIWFKIKINKL